MKALGKLRHDTYHLFAKLLLYPLAWPMTPCCVRVITAEAADGEGGPHLDTVASEWRVARAPEELLSLPDETEVLCPWPGVGRQDVFRFTVGEFRAAWEAAKGERGGGS